MNKIPRHFPSDRVGKANDVEEFIEKKRERHRIEQRRYIEKLRKEGRELPSNKKEYRDKYFLTKPWARHYMGARNRTCFQDRKYFKRGLKFLMKIQDFKDLWFRDKAYELKKPSIDRIYSDVGYEKWNCRFIELQENMTRKKMFWRAK